MDLHHLAFRAEDLARTLAFYRELLGFEVVRDESPRSVWLAIGDGAVLMLEAKQPGEPPWPHGSLELAAFRVSTADKLRIRAQAIEAKTFDGETEHTVYLRDPDGRRVGVSTYPL